MAQRASLAFLLVALAVLVFANPGATAPPPAPPDPSLLSGALRLLCLAYGERDRVVGVTPARRHRQRLRRDHDLERHRRHARLVHVVERRGIEDHHDQRQTGRIASPGHSLRRTRSGQQRLVQPRPLDHVLGLGRRIRHRVLHDGDLQRARHGTHRRPRQLSDNAGNSSSTGFELKYDATPPTVEAKPERAAGLQRLVQPRSHGLIPRHGPHVRGRFLRRARPVQGPRRAEGFGVGYLQGQSREHEPARQLRP